MPERVKTITIQISEVEARALLVALEHGIRAIEAHDLVKDPRLIREAIATFRSFLPGR